MSDTRRSERSLPKEYADKVAAARRAAGLRMLDRDELLLLTAAHIARTYTYSEKEYR
jgi:hypothetical protein